MRCTDPLPAALAAQMSTFGGPFTQLRYLQEAAVKGVTISPVLAGHTLGGAVWRVTKGPEVWGCWARAAAGAHRTTRMRPTPASRQVIVYASGLCLRSERLLAKCALGAGGGAGLRQPSALILDVADAAGRTAPVASAPAPAPSSGSAAAAAVAASGPGRGGRSGAEGADAGAPTAFDGVDAQLQVCWWDGRCAGGREGAPSCRCDGGGGKGLLALTAPASAHSSHPCRPPLCPQSAGPQAAISSAAAAGGSVLMPADTTGRALELLLRLSSWWVPATHGDLFFLCQLGPKVLEYC